MCLNEQLAIGDKTNDQAKGKQQAKRKKKLIIYERCVASHPPLTGIRATYLGLRKGTLDSNGRVFLEKSVSPLFLETSHEASADVWRGPESLRNGKPWTMHLKTLHGVGLRGVHVRNFYYNLFPFCLFLCADIFCFSFARRKPSGRAST